MAKFYADDALLSSQDPKKLQDALDIIVGLFDRVGLWTTTTKTKVLICVPGAGQEEVDLTHATAGPLDLFSAGLLPCP